MVVREWLKVVKKDERTPSVKTGVEILKKEKQTNQLSGAPG